MPDDSTPLGAVGSSAGCPYFFVVAYTLSPALPHPQTINGLLTHLRCRMILTTYPLTGTDAQIERPYKGLLVSYCVRCIYEFQK